MLLWTANVRNYFSLSALPSAAVQPFLIPAILFQASVLSPEKLGAEMYLANGDTSRRGTINLCQKHRSGQCGGATTRAVPRFVAGNCLSARETSRWNFRPPPFPSFSSMSWFRLKIFRRISRVDNFCLCDRREVWRMGNRRFFFENREGKLFFQGEACGGRIKRTSISVRNCDYSKIFMVNDFRNARGIITSWKWNFGFNQNEIVNVGLEYYKRRTYYA